MTNPRIAEYARQNILNQIRLHLNMIEFFSQREQEYSAGIGCALNVSADVRAFMVNLCRRKQQHYQDELNKFLAQIDKLEGE